MKKTNLFKTVLLLCALVVGSSSVWAADVVETLTLAGWGNYTTNSYSASGTDYTGKGGTTNVSYAMQVFNGNNGQPRGNQSGASNFSCRNTSTYSGYYVKQVKLIRGGGSGTFDGSTSGRSVVYFGTSAYANPTTAPSGSSTASAENASGQSSLTWNNSDKTKTYFILYNLKTSGSATACTLQITWASTSSDPSIDADDVTIECDDTSGEIAYTVNNPNGSTLTAAEKTPGYDWIDNVTVDSENSKVTFTATANTGAARDGYITLSYGSVNKDVKVTQRVYVAKYNVNISAMTNGTVIADVATAAADATVTLTITPSSGYKLSTITVTDADEGDVELSGSGNTRTFTMPAKAVTIAATFERDYSITYNFAFESMGTKDNANKDWGGSYTAHTQSFAGADVYFASASKQTGTITDVPVVKNTDVIITLTDANALFKSASFVLKHWNNKVVTITMYYSTNGGESWTSTGQSHSFASTPTYENATLSASSLPAGTNAIKLLAGSEQQYGVASVTVEIDSKVAINVACTDGAGAYYGTYSNNLSFVVPSGLTVSALKVDNEGKLVVMDYAEDDIVKANTGVMVSATSAGDKTVKLCAATGTEKEGNLLKASGDAGIKAANMAEADTKFYRLTMHNGTDIGFWWGAAEGAAFDLAANKAYLAVPTDAGAHEFVWFDEGETTSIKQVEALGLKVEGYYNLNGQRVAQPTKGLYIVNGKKVVIK